MNEMIKAERNKICSRKQTRMLFLAGVVLIVAYFFFFQFNYQNVFYDYDLEKMALASGFTAIEQRKEVAEIFEGKLSQNTLLTMQEKIDQAKQATVGQDENSAFSAVHVYRDQAAILEYLTNSDGSFKSLETAYPNSPTVTLGYCDGWDKLLSGMGSILSIMICLIVVITLSPVFSEEYALHTDSIIYSARYGRTHNFKNYSGLGSCNWHIPLVFTAKFSSVWLYLWVTGVECKHSIFITLCFFNI